MIDRLLNLLLVKRDELGTLLLLGTNLFLATLALIVSQIVAETLFLSAYGGDVLVYIYMVNGVGAVAAGSAYGWLQGKGRAGMFEMVMVMLFAMMFAMIWIGIDGAPPWMLIVLMVFAEIFGTLIILQAWNTNGALLTSRQAKRLMPLISGFGTVAGILSGVLVGSLAGPLGTVNLIGLVIVALMIMTALAYPLAKRLCISMERIAPGPRSEPGPKRIGAGALAVLGNRHIQVILAMTAVATLTSMLVDYQFKVFSQAHFTVDGALEKDRLSSFYGQLQIVISTLALVLQFGMASRVLERFGIAMTLALLPAVILTGAFGIVLGIGSYFAAATLSRSGDKVLKFSLYGSTNQMLFMALPEHLQKAARTLSNAIVRPATFILAGVLLIVVTQGAGADLDRALGDRRARLPDVDAQCPGPEPHPVPHRPDRDHRSGGDRPGARPVRQSRSRPRGQQSRDRTAHQGRRPVARGDRADPPRRSECACRRCRLPRRGGHDRAPAPPA
jgi:AAA family ATP:ADP antiporter